LAAQPTLLWVELGGDNDDDDMFVVLGVSVVGVVVVGVVVVVIVVISFSPGKKMACQFRANSSR
jgi:uncharacterized protein (DUF983 family)